MKTTWIIAFTVLIVAASVRLAYLTDFFPNLDDTHVLYAIFFKYDELKAKIYDVANNGSTLYQLLRKLDYYGIVERLYRPMSVSFLTTFAPFQFFITDLLVSPNDSYDQLLWWGRFPSVFFGILAVLNVGLFFLISPHQEEQLLSIPAMSVMAFSWESIIAAQQMHNYCAGLAATTFLLLGVRYSFQANSFKKALSLGILIGFLGWWQYSMIYYGAALLGFYFLQNIHQKSIAIPKIIGYWSVVGVCFALMIAPLLGILKYTGMLSMSTNYWNIGNNGEYLFTIPDNLINLPIYLLKFFIFNFYETFSAMIAFTEYQSLSYYITSAILFVLFVLGGYAIIFYYKTQTKPFVEFTSILAFILIGLILSQKLTLSPTRHQLTLLPFLAVIISYGIKIILDYLKSSILMQKFMISSFTLIVGILFFGNYAQERQSRRALYQEKDFSEFLAQSPQPSILIEYNWTTVAQLMTDVKKKHAVFTAKDQEFLPKKFPDGTNSIVAFNFLGNNASSDSVWFLQMMSRLDENISFEQIRIDTLLAQQTPYSFGYISFPKMLKNNAFVYRLSKQTQENLQPITTN